MSFSIKSHCSWLSRAWVSHWGSADWGWGVCCPDDGFAMGDPLLYFQHRSVFELRLHSETSFEMYLLYTDLSLSLKRVRSSLHFEYVDREGVQVTILRQVIVSFLDLKAVELIHTQGVISLWHVKTCILPSRSHNGCEGCVTCTASAALWS